MNYIKFIKSYFLDNGKRVKDLRGSTVSAF